MAEAPKKKVTEVSVDFTGVESGGRGVHIPEGDYGFEILSVVQKIGKDSKEPYLLFGLKVIKGNPVGMNKLITHNCSLKKNSLWNLRNLLEACGKTIPSKAVKISFEKLLKLQCGATVVDDEYEGKPKSVVSAFFPIADLYVPEKKKADEEAEEAGEEAEVEEPAEGEEMFEEGGGEETEEL